MSSVCHWHVLVRHSYVTCMCTCEMYVGLYLQFYLYITRFYIYPESFIPKYFMLDDLLRKNHFYGLKPCQMIAIIKWSCRRTLHCTRTSSYVTCMYSYVIRMSIVFFFLKMFSSNIKPAYYCKPQLTTLNHATPLLWKIELKKSICKVFQSYFSLIPIVPYEN